MRKDLNIMYNFLYSSQLSHHITSHGAAGVILSRTFCKGSLQGIIFVQGLMTVCVAWIHLLPLTVQSSGEGWRGGE